LAACQRKRLRLARFPSKRTQRKRLRLDGNRALVLNSSLKVQEKGQINQEQTGEAQSRKTGKRWDSPGKKWKQ